MMAAPHEFPLTELAIAIVISNVEFLVSLSHRTLMPPDSSCMLHVGFI
jgi:hypothetical protein